MDTINSSRTRLLLICLVIGVCAALLLPLPAPLARAHIALSTTEAPGNLSIDPQAVASPASRDTASGRAGGSAAGLSPAAQAVVTNTNDSGSGSLRDVINSAVPGETVVFSLTLPATIVLSGGNIGLSTDLTISGPGSDTLTISANNAGDVFVLNNSRVNISGVTLRNANTAGYGGAIVVNSGALTLTNSSVLSNTASAGGGGIFMSGTSLMISNSVFMSNTAPGGRSIGFRDHLRSGKAF